MFKVHQALKVKTGKFAGLAGLAIEVRESTRMVKVDIQGVQDGKTINEKVFLKFDQVEVL
jgi:hypothetical protein